jgi:hypothetical protein
MKNNKDNYNRDNHRVNNHSNNHLLHKLKIIPRRLNLIPKKLNHHLLNKYLQIPQLKDLLQKAKDKPPTKELKIIPKKTKNTLQTPNQIHQHKNNPKRTILPNQKIQVILLPPFIHQAQQTLLLLPLLQVMRILQERPILLLALIQLT